MNAEYRCACCGQKMIYWEQKVLRVIQQVECRNEKCAMYKRTNTPQGHIEQHQRLGMSR